MNNVYMGIDPGAHGAIAVLEPCGRLIVHAYKDEMQCAETIETAKEYAATINCRLIAVLEKVRGFIGNKHPGSRMFKFGENYGYYKGVLTAKKIAFELVTPERWQKDLHCGKHDSSQEHKRALKEQAQRMYPDEKVTLQTADAILIARWAKEFCKL